LACLNASTVNTDHDEVLRVNLHDVVFDRTVFAGANEAVKRLDKRAEESVRKLPGAKDGALDWGDGDIEEFVPVGPGDFGGIIIMIVAEQETQDWLEEERIVVDWDVDQR